MELVENQILDVDGPIEMEPPIKRKRGRPKKVPNLEISNVTSHVEPSKENSASKVENSAAKVDKSALETNRVAGRMSLRPNRRVDVKRGTSFHLFL